MRASQKSIRDVVRTSKTYDLFSSSCSISLLLLLFLDFSHKIKHRCIMSPSAATAAASNNGEKLIRVAIIGAGASGLAAARVFSRSGIEPTVLEQNCFSGGVWKYQGTPAATSKGETKSKKSSPMYRGLRTNLPKEIMAFREFPFPKTASSSSSSSSFSSSYDPSFVTHQAVWDYLQAYQTHFDLTKYIQYSSTVQRLEIATTKNGDIVKSSISPPTEDWPKFELEWDVRKQTEERDSANESNGESTTKTEVFDAVCVCNGHYAKPAFPQIVGLDKYFQGTTLHAVEYDDPADFRNQRVLCVGGRASGSDLAREISAFAKQVYLSDSTWQEQEPETQGNVTVVPPTREVQPDGSIRFENCPTLTPTVDTIIWCTGYDYDFPFLMNGNDDGDKDSQSLIQCVPGERRVMPLYEQLWHARYPTLTFLGIPHSVVPFPEVEFQAEAINAQFSSALSNTSSILPPLEERLQAAMKDACSGGGKENGRVQDTHYLGGTQWDYCRRLAKLAGTFDDTVDDYIATNQVRAIRKGRP